MAFCGRGFPMEQWFPHGFHGPLKDPSKFVPVTQKHEIPLQRQSKRLQLSDAG